MSTDLRLDARCCDHPKVNKLVKRTGDGAFRCWIRLLGWTANNRPSTGDLRGLDDEDIEELARWVGDSGLFARALRELKLLDGGPSKSRVHDWKEHQPYLAYADDRREHARKAAAARWKGKYGETTEDAATSNFAGMPRANGEHSISTAERNAPDPDPAPSSSPNPDPLPTPLHVTERERGARAHTPARERKSPNNSNNRKLGPWPKDFALDAELRSFAAGAGCDAEAEFAAFHDHCLATGKEYADYRRAFMGWIRKADKFGPVATIATAEPNQGGRFSCREGGCEHVCHHKGCSGLPSDVCKYGPEETSTRE